MGLTVSEKIRRIKRKMIVYIWIGIFFSIASIILGINADYWGTATSYIAFGIGGLALLCFWRGFCKFCDKKELEKAISDEENEHCKGCIYSKKYNNSNLADRRVTELPNENRCPTEREVETKFQKAREARGIADFEKAKAEANEALKSYKDYQEMLKKALEEFV